MKCNVTTRGREHCDSITSNYSLGLQEKILRQVTDKHFHEEKPGMG